MERVEGKQEVPWLEMSEEICLDGRHILGKLFPGTLGRVMYGSEAHMLKNCKYCVAERHKSNIEY